MLKKELLQEMSKVYDEFSIDIHKVPYTIQSQVNSLIKEIIKLRSYKAKHKRG